MASVARKKIGQIYDILPQFNCGLCGYDNCSEFATAVAEAKAAPRAWYIHQLPVSTYTSDH